MIDKQWMIAEIRSKRQAFNESLSQISAEKIEQPITPGGMTVKEVVYHIAWHEDQMKNMIKARAFVGSPWWNLSTDERNAHIQAEASVLSVEEVLPYAEASFGGMLAELEALPAEALDDPAFFAGMPLDWSPADIIAQNTYQHYPEHYFNEES